MAGHGIFRAYLFDRLRTGHCNEVTKSYQLWPLYTTPYGDDTAGTCEFRLQFMETYDPTYIYVWRLDRMPPANFHDCGEQEVPHGVTYAEFLAAQLNRYASDPPVRIPAGFVLPRITYLFGQIHLNNPAYNAARWQVSFFRGGKECLRKTRERNATLHDQGLADLEEWTLAQCVRHQMDSAEIQLSVLQPDA